MIVSNFCKLFRCSDFFDIARIICYFSTLIEFYDVNRYIPTFMYFFDIIQCFLNSVNFSNILTFSTLLDLFDILGHYPILPAFCHLFRELQILEPIGILDFLNDIWCYLTSVIFFVVLTFSLPLDIPWHSS